MKRRELLQLSALTAASVVFPAAARGQDLEGERLARVERILAGLSLDEKIGQMMMSYPPLEKTGPVPVGSVIFVGNLLKSESAVVERVESLQSRSSIPLLIAADVEGGKLNKLSFLPGLEAVPSNRELADEGEEAAREWGRRVGAGMRRLGINMALAPVLDVAGSGMMFESGRSFGADPATAAQLGQAYSAGLAESGVVAVGKHWPGYGSLSENTDHNFVVTSRSSGEVERQAQAFVGCGDAIVGVMLANVGFDSYGSVPAILSADLVKAAHRQAWLAITDDLAIDALAEATGGDKEEVVRRAFLAGNDILLTTAPIDWDRALDYRGIIRALVDERPDLVSRVDDSVHRILRVKARAGLLD
ncbi:MAG TPA: glycoside hydrolase family 3 N-terminal domain-containing protein [Myxococcota bacterium]|nr:glycoside hydrolase family 3 N-terminal domain-containing protein [Myxococcota bacterium]